LTVRNDLPVLKRCSQPYIIWRMSRRASIVLAIAGAVATVLLLIAGWVAANSRDIAAPDTSDLVPEVIYAPDDDNAYAYFGRACAVLYWPANNLDVASMLAGWRWDEAYAAELISRNAETLALVQLGLACGVYEPRQVRGPGAHRPLERLKLSQLLSLKAIHERRAGCIEGALATSCDLLRLGSLIAANPAGVIDYAAGLVALEHGFKEIGHLLAGTPLDEAQLALLSRRLCHSGSLEQGWVRAVKKEHDLVSGVIARTAPDIGSRHKFMANYRLQSNRTKADFARVCRKMMQAVSLPYAEMDLPQVASLPPEGPRRFLSRLCPNSVGRLLVPRPDYMNRFLARKCQSQSHRDGLRLVIACRLYEIRHGQLPQTLDEFVPGLLEAVPPDPFDGKPFRYSREDAVVYSVGMDLKDSWSAGEHATDALLSSRGRGNTDDLVYSIRAPAE
jgi:hypothetical protein